MDVVVVDLEMGNIRSLSAAIEYLGARYRVSEDPRDLSGASHVILPGVGAYDAAMERLAAQAWSAALRGWSTTQGRPLLGVCLGMQLLCESSEEGKLPGLGLAPGRFRRLVAKTELRHKVPHVGFAPVYGFAQTGLFHGLGDHAYFYFTHSYALDRMDAAYNIGRCDHAQPFVAAFQKDNLCGTQFHPEKSQAAGLRVLANFLRLGQG